MEEVAKDIKDFDRLIEILDDNRPISNHYPRVYALLRQTPEEANSSLDGKASPEEVQTEDGGYEYMVETYPKSC